MISLELIKNISLFLSNEERHKISFLVIMNILLLHQLQYILIINILNLNIKMKNYLCNFEMLEDIIKKKYKFKIINFWLCI
jgi:hypothetical protein